MVMSGQVLESWTACLRVLLGGHQNVGGFLAVGIGQHAGSPSDGACRAAV